MILLNIYLWICNFEGVYGIPHIAKYLLSIYILGSFLYYSCKNWVIPQILGIDRLALWLFVTWSILLLIGSFRTDIFYIQEIFGGRYYFIPFLLPLFFLFTQNELYFFKLLLRYTFILTFFAVAIQLYSLIFKRGIESWYDQYTLIMTFDLATPLLLFVSHLYKKRSVTILAIIYYLNTIFLSALWGRRGWFLANLLLFILFIIIRIKSDSVHPFRKFKIAFIFSLSALTLVALSPLYVNKLYIFERGIDKSGWEDSRGKVVEDFFEDFKSQKDWLLGRGLNGTVLRTILKDGDQARFVEIGYLNILLKGGLLFLIPMLTLFLRSSYLGFFKTNNDLTKGLAAVIILQVAEMFTFGMADFSPRYILVCIATAACYNRHLRSISNKRLMIILNK